MSGEIQHQAYLCPDLEPNSRGDLCWLPGSPSIAWGKPLQQTNLMLISLYKKTRIIIYHSWETEHSGYKEQEGVNDRQFEHG